MCACSTTRPHNVHINKFGHHQYSTFTQSTETGLQNKFQNQAKSKQKQHLICTVDHYAVPEDIHTPPTEGMGISWGVGGSARPKNLKKCMKPNWNFQRGGGSYKKNPFRGGGSGTTH